MKNSTLHVSDTKLWRRLLLAGLTGAAPLFIVSAWLIETSDSSAIQGKRLPYYALLGLGLLFSAIVTGWIIRALIRAHDAGLLKSEEVLRAGGEKFSKAFMSSPSGLAITEMETGRFMEVNESLGRLYGYAPKEMVGRTSVELGIYGSAAERDRMLQPLRAGGSLRDLEIITHTRHGDNRTILINAELIQIGGKSCVVSLIQDITERKRVEEIVREKQSQLVLAMDIARLAHWEFDVTKNLVTADENFFLMLGTISAQEGGFSMSPEDYIRKFVHPMDADRVAHEMALGAATTDPHFTRQYEHRIVRADGTEGVMMTRSRIVMDATGRTVKIRGASQDITEQKRAQEELIWKTAFLEAQVNSAIDGILVVDKQGRKILQNQRMTDLWKIPPPIKDDPDDSKQIQFIQSRVKNPGPFAEKVARLYAHPEETGADEIEVVDGTILERYSAPVRGSDGEHYGRVWIFRDITERRKLEEQFRQSQKMEAIGQLAGGVAHDFNNILAIIGGNLELFLMTTKNLEKAGREYLSQIAHAAERAATLNRQLLTFSRSDAMQMKVLDLNSLTASFTKMLCRVVGEHIQVENQLAPALPPIKADPGMVEQVLMNLAVNARDAMPKGGRLIIGTEPGGDRRNPRQKLDPQAHPGDFACLFVRDTGTGIAPENMSRIFEPFFTTKGVGKGTGLGLATVFGIAEQHKGWVDVSSQVGVGTTFRVFLPLSLEAGPAPGSAAAQKISGGSEKVLLVEDEEGVRSVILQTLQNYGYTVMEADSAISAQKIWAKQDGQFDLLLTDMVMPGGMTGLELIGLLRLQKPGLKVMLTSGYSADLARGELARSKGITFLHKPFASQVLAETVRKCLDAN